MTALVGGLGLWWALGLNGLIVHVFAVPMVWQLLRARRVRLPRGFGLWLLFLAWCVAGLVMLDYDPPGTIPDTANGRLVPVAFRLTAYLVVAVVLLYVGNLDTTRYSQRKLARVLGVGFIWVVLGGLLAMVAPYFEFTSPLELVLPESYRSNLFVRSLVHPAAAQVQDVLGYAAPRPAAPFGYTNMWGHAFALLLPWFVVGFIVMARGAPRLLASLFLVVAVVPLVHSLNRGLWVGVAVSLVYLVTRLVAQGRLWVAATAGVVVAVGALVLVFSPLHSIVAARLDNGASDDIRSYSTRRSLEIATSSPVIGFGNTRTAIGGTQSIAVGRSSDCPRCGNQPLGINGQLWFEVVSHGFVGAGLYVATILYVGWRYRRDRTAVGMTGVLTALLMLWFMFIYGALVAPLAFAFIAWAALWRNQRMSAVR